MNGDMKDLQGQGQIPLLNSVASSHLLYHCTILYILC